MSVLVVGVSHRTATLGLLERFAVSADDVAKLATSVLETAHVREALVLTTCNRVEVYAEVERFHGSVYLLRSCTFFEQKFRFRGVELPHAIADEAVAVAGDYGDLADSPRQR